MEDFEGFVESVSLTRKEITVKLTASVNTVTLDIFTGIGAFRRMTEENKCKLLIEIEKNLGKFYAKGHLYNSNTLIAERVKFYQSNEVIKELIYSFNKRG